VRECPREAPAWTPSSSLSGRIGFSPEVNRLDMRGRGANSCDTVLCTPTLGAFRRGCSTFSGIFFNIGSGDFLLDLLRRQKRHMLPLNPVVDELIEAIATSSRSAVRRGGWTNVKKRGQGQAGYSQAPQTTAKARAAERAGTWRWAGVVGFREDGNGGPRTGDRKIVCGAVLSRWLSVTCTLRRFPSQASTIPQSRDAKPGESGVIR
jgi:hypothetical protein